MTRYEERAAAISRTVPRGAPSDAARARLRVGVFAPARTQPRWLADAIAAIDDPVAEIVIVAAGGGRAEPAGAWRACQRLDRRVFGSGPDPSAPVDLGSGPRACPLSWLPGKREAPGALAAWRAGVRALQLDVALALGTLDHLGLEDLARYGAWRYGFGETRDGEERTAGWREAVEWAPVTHSCLIAKLPGKAGERLLYRSCSMTVPYSVARNRENVLRKASRYLERALRELQCAGPSWLAARPPITTRAPAAPPRAAELIGGLGRIALRIGGRALQKAATIDQWALAYSFGATDWDADLRAFTRLLPPRSGFWADPFPLVRGGRGYIFFEDYSFATSRGCISVVEVAPGGGRSAPERVLERGYHLSYPFLVEHDGELFMVPESGENGTVDLYRCTAFPNRWRHEATLLSEGRYLDATLHHADQWWMFVNVAVPGTDGHDELHLYHAERLTGPWRPHARNPVKSDARSARPAGRLFVQDGRLYRPAQVCAPLYGSGVSINRVLRLTPEEYAEREEHRIGAARAGSVLGVHTLNRAGDLSVIDVFLRRPRVAAGGWRGPEPARLARVHGVITKPADN